MSGVRVFQELPEKDKKLVVSFVEDIIREQVDNIVTSGEEWNGEYPVLKLGYDRFRSFVAGIVNCLGDMISGCRSHKLNKDFFMAYRAFFDKKYYSMLCAKIYTDNETSLTGFSMLEAIGMGELLKVQKRGKLCFGFSPNVRLFPIYYHAAQRNCVELGKTPYRKSRPAAILNDVFTEELNDMYYPNMEYYKQVLANVKPAFNISRMTKFLRENVFLAKGFGECLKKYQELDLENKKVDFSYIITRVFHDICSLLGTKNRFRYMKEPELVRYSPRFNISMTGRIHELGGVQGISRISKKILFDEIHNYDLSNSHFQILAVYIQDMLKEIGKYLSEIDYKRLDNGGIEKYLSTRDIKQTCAEKLNISVDDWKSVAYGYLFGSDPYSPYSTIQNIFWRERNRELLSKRMKEIKQIISEYFLPLFVWRSNVRKYVKKKFIVKFDEINNGQFGDIYIPKHHKVGYYNGLVYIPLVNPRLKDNKFLSAFILQGVETKAICEIIRASQNPVISHEFDGVLTSKPLDMNMVDNVLSGLGLNGLKLIEKKFQSKYYDNLIEA